MENTNAHHEITRPNAAQPANNAIRSAAMDAYQFGYSAKQEVAVEDDTRAVNLMFHNGTQQEAAYRIMMHDQNMRGYPTLDSNDLKQFSNAELGEINKFVANYKPSLDVARVQKEEAELVRMGFPKMHQP
jgi:hypothetical protein